MTGTVHRPLELPLPGPNIRQIEVVYANWESDLDIQDFLVPAQGSRLHPPIGPYPEEQVWIGKYLIVDEGTQPIAKLVCEAQTALRMIDNQWTAGSQLNFTFRVPTSGRPSVDDIANFCQLGRRHIDTTFTALTTQDAHTHWERYK